MGRRKISSLNFEKKSQHFEIKEKISRLKRTFLLFLQIYMTLILYSSFLLHDFSCFQKVLQKELVDQTSKTMAATCSSYVRLARSCLMRVTMFSFMSSRTEWRELNSDSRSSCTRVEFTWCQSSGELIQGVNIRMTLVGGRNDTSVFTPPSCQGSV